MKKIAIITTYHGNFPNYIDFWIQSVGFNPTIDFFLFTDLEVKNAPKNLIVVKKSFDEIVKMAQDNFDFHISCARPYKYPDYRPAFGEIFHDYIKDYDFWGYSEHDMIYGDIRKFITEDLLSRYDRLLGNGHLSLYRNNPDCNSAYKQCPYPTYKTVYSHERNFYFEEYGGTSNYWGKEKGEMFYQNREILSDVYPSVSYFIRREDRHKGIKNMIFSFEKGRVYRIFVKDGSIHKVETLYMHFQKRPLSVETELSDMYMVVPNKIVPFISEIDITLLKKLTRKKIIYRHYFKILKQRYKERWMWRTQKIDMQMK